MDFDFTEEQEMLRKSARCFLKRECPASLVRQMAADSIGYPPELWRKMAELGWVGLAVPERYGGMGMGFIDLVILLEEMGRACLPGPFFSTAVIGAFAILDAGNEDQKNELLPKLSNGDIILSLALLEPGVHYDPVVIELTAELDDDCYVLNGTKLFVENAHVADYIITAAHTSDASSSSEGISLFLVDAKSSGMTIEVQDTIVDDKQCEVKYDRVKVPRGNLLGELNAGWPVIEKVLEVGVAAFCARMLGWAQAAFEMSVDYAKERVQFDQPIGSFQAIQHYCADMMIDTDACRFMTYKAAWEVAEGLPAAKEVAMAKFYLNEACYRITLTGHRIHAAVGICMDHDMPLYFKRAWSAVPTFGDSSCQREIIAVQMGL
ncbi:MAG: acyl-CoA dehydrogenase family protein [Chloroflexota bacterium]|nr:acyl-CoA dehydrogenase family protein [Chloroflexota bacterium]